MLQTPNEGAFTSTLYCGCDLSSGVRMWWTAEERNLWTATLELEERDRIGSLRASINALEAEEMPAPHQINALLVSALQAQATLMRMSRVFPNPSSSRLNDVTRALGHGPTVALASELGRAWKVLGMSDPALVVLLRQVICTVGEQTRRARAELFVNLIPNMRRGVDPQACTGLAAEGSGQFSSCLS